MQTIADRIMWLIEDKEQWNKRQFALKVEMNPSYVSQLDKHREMEPSKRLVEKIAATYNVNLPWLLEGTGNPYPEKTIGEQIGQIARAAAKNKPEEVDAYLQHFFDGWPEADRLVFYEVLRRNLPRLTGQEKENKE